MSKSIQAMAIVATVVLLTACGNNTGDRAVSGGAIGAGVGAVGSGLVGGSVLGGALVGGAVGAGAGALTSPNDVNLGKPVWR